MEDISDKIKKLKEEIRKTPYHKGTEHYIGKLRARIAQLEDQLLGKTHKKSGGGGPPAGGFTIKKSGDATVVLIGPPSVGKSTLLNKLTNATSKVAAYAFTTVSVIPGMMHYNGASIQILDLPGILQQASFGRGHGREILSAARAADILLIMTDVDRIDLFTSISQELTNAGVRLNQQPPKVLIKKKNSGGLSIRMPSYSSLTSQLVSSVASEFHLVNAEITIREDLTLDQLIDAFSANRVYTKAIFVVNKIELKDKKFLADDQQMYPFQGISAQNNIGLAELKKLIWEKLEFIRIFLRKPTGEIDYKRPMILKSGATIQDLAGKISTDKLKSLKGAQIWGTSASYAGQKVGVNYILHGEQIVTLI